MRSPCYFMITLVYNCLFSCLCSSAGHSQGQRWVSFIHSLCPAQGPTQSGDSVNGNSEQRASTREPLGAQALRPSMGSSITKQGGPWAPKSESLECKAQLGHCLHVTRTSATFQSPEVLLIKHPWLHDDEAMLITWPQGVGLNEIT